ncbi:MAG: hypothetical protein Q9163_003700 [Psora crenata]
MGLQRISRRTRSQSQLWGVYGRKVEEGMSLNVSNAHTGASLFTDPRSYTSLEELRSWIFRKYGTQAIHQILMTARGKQVKFQTLIAEPEVFVYDRSILASSTSVSELLPRVLESTSTTRAVDDPPDGSINADTLSDWKNIFEQRRSWAQQLRDASRETAQKITELQEEIKVVQRGAMIAVESMRQHTENLKPKYQQKKAWADKICEDQDYILGQWKHSRDTLATFAVTKNFTKCLRDGERGIERASARSPTGEMTLEDLVDESILVATHATGDVFAKRFKGRVSDLEKMFRILESDVGNVTGRFFPEYSTFSSNSGLEDQASHLLEEAEILSRKISSDCETVGDFHDGRKAILQASKTSQLHKNNFVPSLLETSDEIAQLLQHTVQRKQNAMKSSIRYLQKISLIESKISALHTKLATMDVDAEHSNVFVILKAVIKLPSIYGIHLVEYIRRCEWMERALSVPYTSNSYIVRDKEQEEKRRAEWHKGTEGVIGFGSLGDIGMDVALGNHTSQHLQPLASREDVVAYIDRLREKPGLQEALREVSEAFEALPASAQQQSRVPIAFKKGSLHEAAYGRNSTISQADPQVLAELRGEKLKADEKLRSAESRIRKLEDLLHRQSQVSRPWSASGFGPNMAPTFERHVTTPVANFSSALSKARDAGSPRSSTSSRRVSQNMEPEERGLAERIVGLEAELAAQKAQSRDLERKAAARQNAEESLKSQAQEAIATKEDLLSNLEAQQREFENERKLLEEDKGRLKLQLEDLEDELDRVHDTNAQNDDIYALNDQHEKCKQDAYEREKALRSDLAARQDRCSSLEKLSQEQSLRLTELESTVHKITARLQNQEHAQAGQHRALRSSLLHLTHEVGAPEDFNVLVETMDRVAQQAANQQKQLQDALEIVQEENAKLQTRVKLQENDISGLRENLGSAEQMTVSLHNDLSRKEIERLSLQSQLDSVIEAQDSLQSELAKSNTGRETLRQQLVDKDDLHDRLTAQLADVRSQWNDVNTQLSAKAEALTSLQQRHNNLISTTGVQALRAEEVSKRFQVQNESLRRLLEQIGYTITKQEQGMVIQKLPKSAANASTTPVDHSVPMKRSMSGVLPTKAELETLIESDTLHWAKVQDPEEAASRYEEFLNSASTLDIERFNEAVYRRIKDVEHIARKWQREARAYRDKSHRAQSEARERIAIRSFKEGDLALFLPTRDQATKPWAAFNVGAPHYFLREQDSHKLGKRDWLIARISKVEERVVDLSRSINGLKASGISSNEENPYELSDGLRWYLLDAAEEKPGAPINIGTGKATVALAETDKPVKGSIGLKKSSDGSGATKTLTRSLDSRRSSSNSKKGIVAVAANSTSAPAGLEGMLQRSNSNTSSRAADKSSLDVDGLPRPETCRKQDILHTDASQDEQVRIISARDW